MCNHLPSVNGNPLSSSTSRGPASTHHEQEPALRPHHAIMDRTQVISDSFEVAAGQLAHDHGRFRRRPSSGDPRSFAGAKAFAETVRQVRESKAERKPQRSWFNETSLLTDEGRTRDAEGLGSTRCEKTLNEEATPRNDGENIFRAI